MSNFQKVFLPLVGALAQGLAQVLLAFSKMKQLREVTAYDVFRASIVPDLGLSGDPSLPLRVYVLQCRNGCIYVGISPKEKILSRLSEQFDARSEFCSEYCRKNVPTGVLCVWPAASEAIEAAFCLGMVRALRLSDWSKLGGWTQTSDKVSPLVVMQMTQAKRQLTNRCFDCGGSHHAGHRSCRGSNLDCWYKCVCCKERNNVSSRGQSTLKGAVAEAPPPAAPRPAAGAKATAKAAARASAPMPAPVPRKRPAGAAFGEVVCKKTFDECWDGEAVRKEPPPPKVARYACVKDFLKEMDTIKAGSAQKTIAERLKTLAKNKHWPKGSWDYFPEFGRQGGGGSAGVGCTRAGMQDIFLDRGGREL